MEKFKVSPDSTTVVYLADQEINNVTELYTVPIAGGTPVNLSGDIAVEGIFILDTQISADSENHVYKANQGTGGFHLFNSYYIQELMIQPEIWLQYQ